MRYRSSSSRTAATSASASAVRSSSRGELPPRLHPSKAPRGLLSFQRVSGRRNPSTKLTRTRKGLGKNLTTSADIGTCTSTCETRHEKPENQWNFAGYLKTSNKEYEHYQSQVRARVHFRSALFPSSVTKSCSVPSPGKASTSFCSFNRCSVSFRSFSRKAKAPPTISAVIPLHTFMTAR